MPFPYLPHTPEQRREMLAAIGVDSIDDLYEAVPASLKLPQLDIPPTASEWEASRILTELAAKNVSLSRMPSFLGGGAYQRFIPSAVRSILGRTEFSSAYTPYQPEISQ